MATINITITESPFQLVAGIPASIVITTNVPSTVFYSLDGKDPTIYSSVVVGPITLPTDRSFVTFKAFATNGVITSPIITQVYGSSYGENDSEDHMIPSLN